MCIVHSYHTHLYDTWGSEYALGSLLGSSGLMVKRHQSGIVASGPGLVSSVTALIGSYSRLRVNSKFKPFLHANCFNGRF